MLLYFFLLYKTKPIRFSQPAYIYQHNKKCPTADFLSAVGHPSLSYFTKLLFTQPLLPSFGKYTQVYPFRVQS